MDNLKKYLWGMYLLWAVVSIPGTWAAETMVPLTLDESIDIALKQSVVLHAAKEGVRGAEALQKEAFTRFLPKFSTSYNYTRLNEDPYFAFPGVPPLVPSGNMTTGTKDNYSWNVEARQPLFAGGGILANYEGSRLAADIARLEEAVTVQDLVQEVKISYFSILKASRLLDVAKQSMEERQAHRDLAQGFFDVGLIPRNDLLFAEVELANSHQLLLRAENSLDMAKAKFNTILRRNINTPVKIEDILKEQTLGTPLDACIAAALENRPEIRSFLLRVEQAQSDVKLSKSEYYPNVSLVGNYSRYGDTASLSGSPYKPEENWYVIAVANWNFWEWGKTKNRVDAGISRENQATDGLTHLRDQITLEVKNAYLLLQETEKQVQVMKKAIEQAEENFRINTERYREQIGTTTDVIDAQTLLTRAKANYFAALGDFSINQARLERAMGMIRVNNQLAY
jgi:outer membrane protein